MPFTIDETGPILRVDVTGTFTNRDLEELAERADEVEARYETVPHRVTDLRQVQRLEIDFEGVYALAVRRRALHFPNRFKSAIIAVDLVAYGFARMFQTLNFHPQIVIALFPDDAEAMRWIAEPGLEMPSRAWVPSSLSA